MTVVLPSPQSSDETTSRSTWLSKNDNQVAGYPASVRGSHRPFQLRKGTKDFYTVIVFTPSDVPSNSTSAPRRANKPLVTTPAM